MRVIEKVIGKEFEAGTLPEPQEICTKQLYRVMDELERIEVDDVQIAPFLPEIYRKLEWLTKEDLVKRIVSREFGRFLNYYANAPEIVQPTATRNGKKGERNENKGERRRAERQNGPRQAEAGYKRLFINLGKRDNYYAREIINLVNRYVKGKVQIGRIDLTTNCSFFEVPEAEASLVIQKMAKAKVGERRVVVDSAEREQASAGNRGGKERHGRTKRFEADASPRDMKKKWKKEAAPEREGKKKKRHEDWRQFFE